MLEANADARERRVILAYTGFDGFCTNIDALYEFFRVYVNIVITFVVYQGKKIIISSILLRHCYQASRISRRRY